VMQFGLTNTPAVFYRLMEVVLRGLNPESSPDLVTIYTDNIVVFYIDNMWCFCKPWITIWNI